MSTNYGVEAELDIFSGRPNPRWMLSAEQLERLRRQLNEPVPAAAPPPLGLGYRGFVITNLGQDRSIPQQLRVYRSVVIVIDRERRLAYRDTAGLEDSLLDYARRLGYEEAIAAMGGPAPQSRSQ